jgi:predicted DNA-binding protein
MDKKSQDPSIKIKKEIKDKLENLDFVKRHTHNKIIKVLIEFYEKNKNKKGVFVPGDKNGN